MTDRRDQGLAMMDQVYGPGFSAGLDGQHGALSNETVEHLFGEVWSRPGLSVRERRLLVLGATAALGRSDLIRVQVRGALANAELTAEQLDEMVLQLAFYVGWGNATEVQRGVAGALADQAGSDRADARDETGARDAETHRD